MSSLRLHVCWPAGAAVLCVLTHTHCCSHSCSCTKCKRRLTSVCPVSRSPDAGVALHVAQGGSQAAAAAATAAAANPTNAARLGGLHQSWQQSANAYGFQLSNLSNNLSNISNLLGHPNLTMQLAAAAFNGASQGVCSPLLTIVLLLLSDSYACLALVLCAICSVPAYRGCMHFIHRRSTACKASSGSIPSWAPNPWCSRLLGRAQTYMCTHDARLTKGSAQQHVSVAHALTPTRRSAYDCAPSPRACMHTPRMATRPARLPHALQG